MNLSKPSELSIIADITCQLPALSETDTGEMMFSWLSAHAVKNPIL